MPPEPSTARPLAVRIRIQEKDYLWTPEEGLDPSAAATVENWIWKRARALSRLAAIAGLAVEDLVQEGRIGALRAARTYEPGHAANYLTWSVYWIRNAMMDALDGPAGINIPRDQRRTFHRAAQHVPVFSLDAPIPGGLGEDAAPTTWTALLASEPEPADEMGQRARAALRAALNTLRPQDRDVLLRRYGFRGEPETLESIANSWGLSRQRISQIEARARLRLRAAFSRQTAPRLLPLEIAMAKTAHPTGIPFTLQDRIRQQNSQARAKAKAEAVAREHRKQAAAGSPLFHLLPGGNLDTRESCPDCEPAGSGIYHGRICECCGGSGVVEPMP